MKLIKPNKETNKELKELDKNLKSMFPKEPEQPKKKGFFKDKNGNRLTAKEFFKRWGDGIKNLTPEQRLTNEARATLISLVGFIVSFVSIIVFMDQFIVNWFAYGLLLIFVGSIVSNSLKWLALKQQLRILKNMKINSIDIHQLMSNINLEGKA